MANLGKCPDCPPGTKDRILVAGKCPYHLTNPVVKKSRESGINKPETGNKTAKSGNKSTKGAKKNRKPIPKRSAKKIADDLIYAVRQPLFLQLNPKCQIQLPGCRVKSTQVHHARGRGKYYLDESTWKACCDGPCHRKITDESKKAIEDGHSERRNGPVNQEHVFDRKKVDSANGA